jgi:hypothetical protein
MKRLRMRKPSASLVVAMIALFVALGGTAGAVVTAAVPLAKRALVADSAKVALNAKKLEGQSAAQVIAKGGAAGAALAASTPGPASTAAGLVSYKTITGVVGPQTAVQGQVACDSGQKVLSGGYTSTDGAVQPIAIDGPLNDTTWSWILLNFSTSAAAPVTLYAVCLK